MISNSFSIVSLEWKPHLIQEGGNFGFLCNSSLQLKNVIGLWKTCEYLSYFVTIKRVINEHTNLYFALVWLYKLQNAAVRNKNCIW